MKANLIHFWWVESEFIVKNQFHNWTCDFVCIWLFLWKIGLFLALFKHFSSGSTRCCYSGFFHAQSCKYWSAWKGPKRANFFKKMIQILHIKNEWILPFTFYQLSCFKLKNWVHTTPLQQEHISFRSYGTFCLQIDNLNNLSSLKSIKKTLSTFFLLFAILFMLFTALITCIWQHRLSWKIMLYPIFWSRVQAFPELSELFLNSFNIRFFTTSIIT